MGHMTSLVLRSRAMAAALGIALLLIGCEQRNATPFEPPPRATDKVSYEPQDSVIAVPIRAELSGVRKGVAAAIPLSLWSINMPDTTCIPPKQVGMEVLRFEVEVETPPIQCDIVGEAVRGPVAVEGQGQNIIVSFPVHAVVQAKDIGGILKGEKATADARVRAVVHLDFDSRWNARASAKISYNWLNAPHIDFLGQRIDLTKAVDKELASIVTTLEQAVPREVNKLNVRSDVARLWSGGFAVASLNERNPPVWMRITPGQLQYGGFSLAGDKLVLDLGLRATTETFVGEKPPGPPKTPLPQRAALDQTSGHMTLFVPVVADYDQVVPVVKNALVQRSKRPFHIPKAGDVMIEMVDVTGYGTTNGHVALGLTFKLRRAGEERVRSEGQVWMTALPVNEPNSRKIAFQDVRITGDTNRRGMDLLLGVAHLPAFGDTIVDALTQDFEGDYNDLMARIGDVIEEVQPGNVVIRAKLTDVETGQLKASGQGLFLPVKGSGTASLRVLLD